MNLQAIANIATSLALFVSAGVFCWQILSHSRKVKYERSRFHLDSAIGGFDKAIGLLSDGNNDRIIWNSAARILQLSETISKRITHQDHLDVFAVALETYRNQLSAILGYRNLSKGAAFFYGSNNHNEDIDHAAQNSVKNINDGHMEYSEVTEMDEAALYTLWRAAQFPEDYKDPLFQRFPEEILQRVTKRLMWPGLFAFLLHKRKTENKVT
ncbi:hypothetical protein KP004_08135 [Geomonas oryzisoli]|uniref:DUF4760 domain-containing protein n=1 Tax=Geomonas oryzisoli TaxID=2847992 RepID=A0ABX8J9M8_9BACT|nr:hypothetical protein [Geomonas oryzisoli]QWV95134.1 hypothetical protein KP004_08135 [Geomonas oryzisoli]